MTLSHLIALLDIVLDADGPPVSLALGAYHGDLLADACRWAAAQNVDRTGPVVYVRQWRGAVEVFVGDRMLATVSVRAEARAA